MTNNFAPENELGRGGFGAVYKGELEDGTKLAVKRMEAGVVSTLHLNMLVSLSFRILCQSIIPSFFGYQYCHEVVCLLTTVSSLIHNYSKCYLVHTHIDN